MKDIHIPVLLDQIIDTFINSNGLIIDATLGFGGHSSAILNSNKNVKILACDRDEAAIKFNLEKFKNNDRINIIKSNFSNILNNIKEHSDVVGILADIGISSYQLDSDERGFNINSNSLDMRMDKSLKIDAEFIINNYSVDELARIFKIYAEIKNPYFLAEKIVKFRQKNYICSNKVLSDLVGRNSIKNRKVSNAILVSQAIRIEVNKELNELEILLNSIKNSNINNAKIAIITFHSLEDRIVKNTFKSWEKSCICSNLALKCGCGNNHSIGKILTKKPIVATKDEIEFNPRSSSAKLRIFEIKR